MAHPIRTASRSQRRSLRQQQRASRSTSWRIGALRPVALAACLSVSGPAHLGWAGTMNPMAALSSHAIPVPVIPFIDEATKQRQNIASYGKGKGTVTNDANNDPVKLVIDQETQKAIYNWQSFDIGQASSVVFMLPDKDSSALNRVSNSTSASRIFGSLSSYYGDGKGGLITGGEIYLINRNGILFGKTAKVNVGSLMASALDMSDDDYKSGLQSIKTNQSTFFSWKDGDIATYDPETNYVKVEEGASITTASGGRVFLLGGKVENGGQITAQNGQVVLAAGSEVYLNTPSAVNSPLYMSEANENVPAVKGLLVEVNSSRKAGEYAANTATGVINTPTGNTTIVGWAVNQSGRILATTSISQNGSVFLQARSNVVAQMTNGVTKQATQGGQLVLGDRSSIQITVDQGLDKGGQVPAISANSVFTASRVEMSGQTIEFKDRASDAAGSQAVITAPAAVVNVRAEALPAYSRANLLAAGVTPDGQGKLLVGDGVKIDVSGTKDTTVSVARNFVTTALLGGNDLKDAPIQKDGPIYRSKLTFDIREAAPILGDTSAYKNAVLKSASEFMSAGGNVSLTSTGSVATSNTASIDVSGGQVNYTSAMVNPSVLLGKNGQRYTLNTAPTDQVIVGIAGVGNMTPTRFGTQTAPSLAGMAHMEQGYTEGKDAGKLNVIAPQMVVAAKLNASTVSGRRQLSGLDALAFKGALTLGTMENVSKVGTVYQFGTSGFQSAVLQDIEVTKSVDDLSDFSNERSFGKSAISVEQINKSGFGSVTIASNGNITVDDGADLKLPQNGSLTLRAAAYAESVPVTDPATGAKSTQSIVHNGIVLGGKIQSVGGAVSIESKSLNDAAAESDTLAVGSVHLKDGQSIDVAGNWVNQRLDGTGVAPAVSGGSVSLASGRGLVIGNDVSINVSGGATMNSAGSIKGSNAGSISLISNSEADLQPKNQAAFRVGDNLSLQGYGIDKGGSLTLRAAAVDLVNNTGTSSSIKNGDTVGSVLIGADLLNRGGFQDYTIEGISRLTVTEGTHLTPGKLSWAATPGLRNLATGSALASVMQSLVQPDASRAATNLTLLATGSKMESGGTLSVARGASITGDPGSKLALKAGGALTVEGDLRSAGGQINLALENRSVKINDTQIATLTVASSATLDVSGQAVYQPSSGPFVLGKVLDGGAISIGPGTNASASSVVLLDADATLRADGSAAELDVARPLGGIGPAYTRQTVASNGGSVTVNMVQGGGTLSNRMSAKGGNSTAGGGAFTLTMANKPVGVVRVQSDAATGGYKAGEVTVSSKALTTGQFADVTLQSPQEINFVNSQDWQLPRSLTLSAPVVSVAANSTVNLKTGGIVLMGRPSQFGNVLSALGDTSKDTGTLTLQSGLVGLFGQQAVKGVKSLDVRASSEVRLMGVSESDDVSNTGNMPGALKTGADVALHAPQVTVASASNYTLDAGKATVTIDGGDKGSLAPLSAGSKLTIKAGTINQNGVLRVPFGSITLDASKINFGDGLTSVSGDGLLVPFGFTTGGGKVLTYLEGKEVTAVTEKSIVVKAGSGDAAVSQNAVLDLSGGGAMVAYEFVPGPGGSNDVFAGALNGAFAVVPTITQYAPTDAAILSDGKLSQASGLGNALALGNTIQFGNNGLVPAGSYAILPARYALLPGAYLVKPSTSVTSAVSLDYSQKQTDGAMIVGAQLGSAGMANSNKPASAFVVMSSQTARRYSEIKSTLVDAYFLDKADTAGTTAQRLAIDAGRLAVDAATASLAGQLKFDHDARAQGGQLDLSSATIHVGANKLEGALNVTYEQLNQSGADSIVLGGLRQSTAADGSTGLTVTAGNVVVDAQAKDLSVADLTLAARNGVKVNDGVRIVAASKAIQADDLVVNGNGALVRVSHDAGANTSRNMVDEAAVGAAGDLTLGKNVVLTGGAVVAEATRTTSLANESSNGVIINASKLTLGAQRMVAGNLPSDAAKPGVGTMVLSDQLLSHFNQAQELSLRSFNGIDLFNGASIGGDGMRSLTIDTGNFRVNGDNAVASLRAGSVQLRNTTGVQAQVPTFAAGQLNVNATGLAGGTGHITVGGGAMAVSGVGEVNLNAAGSVVLAGKSELVSPGDINVSANSLTAANGAQASLTAVGRFKLTAPEAPTGVAPAQPGVGAHVSIQADGIEQRGVITLPSGELNLTAKRTILFAGASRTDLAGLTKAIDGVALDSMGGTLSVKTGVGSITQQTGSVVDVSAGGGAGTAGSMNFSAIKGGVQLSGSLLARSRSGQQGGALTVDSSRAVSLNALAQTIDAGKADGLSNFSQSISVRARGKNQGLKLDAMRNDAGQSIGLAAESIDLSADQADVNVNGLLQATSQSGGLIRVAAGGNVNVLESARIEAHADAGNKAVETLGGVVALSSAGMTRADGSLGTVKLLGGSIDTSGLNGAKDGRVKLRARTEAWLADNSAVKTNFSGLRSLSVEAFKAIPATLTGSVAWVDQDVVDQAKLAVSDLFDASLGASKASLIVQRLKGDQALLQDRTDVRAGIEIQSAGDLTLDTDINLFDWRQGTGNVLAAAPVNLTLRAGGDLNVKASISDGFLDQITRDTTMVSRHDFIQDTQAGDITLVGGADLKAAKVLATRAGTSNGDVIIGDGMGDSARDVLVRTTTGDITVSATRDVNLVNPLAVVYTTGRNAPAGASLELPEMGDFSATIQARIDSVDYSVPPDDDGNYAHKISYLNQDPFTMGGGSVRVEAGRDVIQTSDISKSNNPSVAAQQYVTDWWWRTKDSSDSVSWWSRFDIFQQGFATFGGGNVAIQAGRDTWNVSASAAASGSASSKSQVRYGGGSVSVVAGRDVVGGQVFAADDISVQAGRSLTSQTSSDSSLYAKRVVTPNDTVVMYGNGQTKVLARNDLTIGAVTQAALVKSAMPGAQSANDAVLGMAPSASLNVAAIAGDLTLTGNDVTRYKFSTSYDEQLDGLLVDGLPADVSYSRPDITRITMGLSFPQLLPALASWQAGTGSVSLVSSASSGNLYQLGAVTPTSDGVGVNLQAVSMSAIAGNSLYVRSAIQLGSDELAARPHAVPAGLTILANSLDRDSQASSQLIGGNVNAPMRLVAQSGDVTYGRIDSKQPLRLIAGGDIQAESTDSGIRVQQQGENALTLVQAGRDINLVKTNGYGIDFYGPGDAVIVAGRGINLNQSHGLRAQGNRVNAELPSGSANITVLTGVSFAKGDITSSTNAYFELLGGAGVGDFAADLYAQIKAADQGQAMPTLGSDVARSFSALSVADQLDRAKGLVGDTAFQQRVLTFMQHRDNPALTLPEAITQFNALSDRDKSPMVGMLLASAWSAKVPKDAQLSTALSMAASKRDPYSDELVSFMKQRTGSLVSVGEATQQFMNLRPEEQLLFSTKVLVNEMNLAVSKAASLTGSAKTEAYLDAYNALDAMFPTASVRHADLQMGSSTVQTQQGSEIKVFAPSGGINVGQLTSASSKDKSASDLGLITAGGGNLAVVARDDILVNQSRVFTVGNGDELLWSSTGNVDAGRGGKTVTAAASPVFYLDANGILQADVTAAISGSGIASSGKARIAAPKGEINAGDAGISAGGGLELAATVVRGADNIQAPSIAGAPAAAPVNTAMAAPTPNQPTAAGAKDAADNDDAKSRKRKKRNILLDFLGFGSGSEG